MLGYEIKDPVQELEKWLMVYRMMMCVIGLPAMVCCLMGFWVSWLEGKNVN